MTDAPTFDLDQALTAQRRMRDVLGLDEERFPIPAFVGMVSDEIEQLRAAGHSDADIVRLVAEATGVDVPTDAIARYYVEPADRNDGHGR